MSEKVIFEASVTVTNATSEIHDAIEHFRSANYGAPSSRLMWLSVPEEGATATLQDNCPSNGHVLIHLYALKQPGFSLIINGIEREVSANRSTDDPDVKEYAIALVADIRKTLSLVTERFTIHDMVDHFVMWVNEYGYRHQSYYIPHRPEGPRDGRTRLPHSIVSSTNSSVGELIFYIERDPKMVDFFTVTAEPFSGLVPLRSEVLDYLREMAQAIREYWLAKQDDEQGIPTLMNDIPLLPTVPSSDWELDDVFDWYHRGGIIFVPDLTKLANYLSVSPGYIHNSHSTYMKQYPLGRKPDGTSRFAGMLVKIPPVK